MDKGEYNVRAILAGQAPGTQRHGRGLGQDPPRLQGGLSFVHILDGSTFDPLQIVAPKTLPNYADDVVKITSGCAVEATGSVVQSQGKGQAFEMQATRSRSSAGWTTRTPTRSSRSSTRWSTCARSRTCGRARTSFGAVDARAPHAGAWRSTASSTSAASSGSTRRSSRRRDCGGRGRDVPGVARWISPTCRATPEGKVDFAQDFFGKQASSPCRASSTSRPTAWR